ncbi:hypothetical protein KOW79_016120 [Hemibagrus wyckioides]|uniref:Uncharacterized protein n=1 Tax=Hemibagrus wyckioides TaxID=337641 RepID=A0A9D3NG99_9TELE|nr:hypothetical protein KOW79_016120 [Hemibagrus wyckioides]
MDPAAPYLAFTVNWQSKYRIQNVDLWELYCKKKSQLMRIKGGVVTFWAKVHTLPYMHPMQTSTVELIAKKIYPEYVLEYGG